MSGAYSLLLPAAAPVQTPYVVGATSFAFSGNALDAGRYRLQASVPSLDPKSADIVLNAPVVTAFSWP